MSVEKKIEYCAKLRGVYPCLIHRTIHEFGQFLQDMVNFFVFNIESPNIFTKQFQKEIKDRKLDFEKFSTYVDLFVEFWEHFDEIAERAVSHDSEVAGLNPVRLEGGDTLPSPRSPRRNDRWEREACPYISLRSLRIKHLRS